MPDSDMKPNPSPGETPAPTAIPNPFDFPLIFRDKATWEPKVGDWFIAAGSYCGIGNERGCTDASPCKECLEMSNRYVISAEHYGLRFFGGMLCTSEASGNRMDRTMVSYFRVPGSDTVEPARQKAFPWEDVRPILSPAEVKLEQRTIRLTMPAVTAGMEEGRKGWEEGFTAYTAADSTGRTLPVQVVHLERYHEVMQQLEAANKKLTTFARCIEISEKANDAATEMEVALSTSFSEAMAITHSEIVEKERDTALGEVETQKLQISDRDTIIENYKRELGELRGRLEVEHEALQAAGAVAGRFEKEVETLQQMLAETSRKQRHTDGDLGAALRERDEAQALAAGLQRTVAAMETVAGTRETEVERLRTLLTRVDRIATGEDQVAEDDSDGLGVIHREIAASLEASK